MASFSVLTVSKRTGWGSIAEASIKRQTIQPDEWIIVQEQIPCEISQAVPHRLVMAPEKTKLSNLNASLNAGLARVKTEYVIFYQDFIELPADCFEKLLALATPNTFVTTCTPNADGSDDGRYTGTDLPRPCRPEEWEANVALAPMDMVRVLGGFWPELDWGWSWDNVDLACRAAMLGAKFILDESNRPKLLPHEREDHANLPLNGDRCSEHLRDIRLGLVPLDVKGFEVI